jgi:hypothetical protein
LPTREASGRSAGDAGDRVGKENVRAREKHATGSDEEGRELMSANPILQDLGEEFPGYSLEELASISVLKMRLGFVQRQALQREAEGQVFEREIAETRALNLALRVLATARVPKSALVLKREAGGNR